MRTQRLVWTWAFCVAGIVAMSAAAPAGNLVLWNTLDSATAVQNSLIGPDGTISGGSFVPGVCGNAYSADHTEDLLVSFPKEAVPAEAGTIEFWARLTGFPADIGTAQKPYFIEVNDGHTSFVMGFNANDGGGGGGLVGQAGHRYWPTTGTNGTYSYADILGAGAVEDWHHYALVWDKDGITGVDDGTWKAAIFLDGVLNSTRVYDQFGAGGDFAALQNPLPLINNALSQGTTAMDNLKIWDYAKTDFSDRFACPVPEPATLSLLAAAVLGLALGRRR